MVFSCDGMNMDKNWLIRMQDHQILGPVTKEKILELIENGTLKENDEISSGNGYWFWIKEHELLEKYLRQEETQSFNPANSFEGKKGHYIEGTLPEGEDLEYPVEGGWISSEDSFSRMAQQGEVAHSGEISLNKDISDKVVEEDKGDKVDEEGSTDVEILLESAIPPPSDDKNEEDIKLPNEDDLEYPTGQGEGNHKDKEEEKKISSKKAPSHNFGQWASFFKTFFMTIVMILVLLIVLEKVFKYPILKLILPSAGAQETLPTETVKKGLQHLSIERGWEGFVISAKESAVFQDCAKAKSHLVGVFMLLDKRDGTLDRWKSFIKQCSSAIPKDIQAMLNMPKNMNLQQLRNHLNVWELSSKEKKLASEIYRSVARQRNDAIIMGKFIVQNELKKKADGRKYLPRVWRAQTFLLTRAS